jgi:hypothetical protein
MSDLENDGGVDPTTSAGTGIVANSIATATDAPSKGASFGPIAASCTRSRLRLMATVLT